MIPKDAIKRLRRSLGAEKVLGEDAERHLYGYDASLERGKADLVVFPQSREDVVEVMHVATEYAVPIVPRGSGTNLTGGSVPERGGIVVCLARMNRILEIDIENESAVVEPGVFNLDLQEALAPHGYQFAPDPASQRVATLGGNIAENSGGPHCLKYGVTSNHTLGIEVVLTDGRVVELGSEIEFSPGYDLVGVFVGSEGTFGLATRIRVKLTKLPPHVATFLGIYDSVDRASESVSKIITSGILPATLEMMDNRIIRAVEASLRCGYPLDAAAVLIVELDGLEEDVEAQAAVVQKVLKQQGAREVRLARSKEEREQLWRGRRGAFGAIARIQPNYIVMDGTVPRTKLAEVIRRTYEIGEHYRLEIANVFHAGDGNLHPLVFFETSDPAQRSRAIQAANEIIKICLQVGGTLSGEHGIGMEKKHLMPLLFSPADLHAMKVLKEVFDPTYLLNPGKVFPDSMEGPSSTILSQRPAAEPRPLTKGEIKIGDEFEPTGESEAREILKGASVQGRKLLIIGSGTKLDLVNPEEESVLLSSRGFDRISDFDPENMTIRVGSGTSFEDMQNRAGLWSLRVPTLPPQPTLATVGGILATGLPCPLALRYGLVRDWLTGIRFVSGAGHAIAFGGKAVKNVSGYDLRRLFAGSFGTLGLITEATFRLIPCPAATLEMGVFFDSVEELLTFHDKALHSALWPAALELLSPTVSAWACGKAKWAGIVLLEGTKTAVDLRAGQLARDWKADAVGEGTLAKVMEIGFAADDRRQAEAAKVILSVPKCQFPTLVAGAARSKVAFAAGRGRQMVIAVSPNPADPELPRLCEHAAQAGGWSILVRAGQPTRFSPTPASEFLMRRIKERFDPAGVLPSLPFDSGR